MGRSTVSKFDRSEITVSKTPTSMDFLGYVYVNDHYVNASHVACRFNGGFRNADEVLRTIAVLKTLLPVIDRLGSIE